MSLFYLTYCIPSQSDHWHKVTISDTGSFLARACLVVMGCAGVPVSFGQNDFKASDDPDLYNPQPPTRAASQLYVTSALLPSRTLRCQKTHWKRTEKALFSISLVPNKDNNRELALKVGSFLLSNIFGHSVNSCRLVCTDWARSVQTLLMAAFSLYKSCF